MSDFDQALYDAVMADETPDPDAMPGYDNEPLASQVDRLALVLMDEFGGPTRSEGAIDMAIRVLREQRDDPRLQPIASGHAMVDVYLRGHASVKNNEEIAKVYAGVAAVVAHINDRRAQVAKGGDA